MEKEYGKEDGWGSMRGRHGVVPICMWPGSKCVEYRMGPPMNYGVCDGMLYDMVSSPNRTKSHREETCTQ